ncbi:UNVERIFIED_CONTAM: sigma 54-interacting transcriptional regulator [Halobacillus marinus]|uniref:sigma-54 interaction domain-containing protein n=1 Tax=Bacillaceae TaxID=186817 RepID=UPI00041C5A09|nr:MULTISPECIES: sigma 54-interacting transcriptional regulator [Bacillaceae]QHT47856.1 PAS domain-containing protein [Bacillus sp. SB49]
MDILKLQDYQMFKDIVEHSFDEIFVTDQNGMVLYVNESCEQNYGIPSSALIGKHIYELAEELFTPSATVEVMKQECPVEVMQETKQGRRLLVKSQPVFDPVTGELTKVISYSRDLTDFTTLKNRMEQLEKQLNTQQNEKTGEVADLITESKWMKRVTRMMTKVAGTEATVLLKGETGVGKNLLASKIHKLSSRRNQKFYEVNCADLPDHLLETELFGNPEYGVEGLIELTDGCTLFLDAIGEMSIDIQGKLLRVLETKQIVSKHRRIDVDIRFLFSTNQNLEERVKAGTFRKDLFYRIHVVPIDVPPLRDREADIYPLSMYFLKKYNALYDRNVKLSPLVLHAFYEYDWPGNVRELENLIERLLITTDSDEITMDQLPSMIKTGSIAQAVTLPEKLEQLERFLVAEAYDQYGSSYKVAESLGISQSSAMRKIQKYLRDGRMKVD